MSVYARVSVRRTSRRTNETESGFSQPRADASMPQVTGFTGDAGEGWSPNEALVIPSNTILRASNNLVTLEAGITSSDWELRNRR